MAGRRACAGFRDYVALAEYPWGGSGLRRCRCICLEAAIELCRNKTPAYQGVPLKEQQLAQFLLGKAASRVEAARDTLFRAADVAYADAESSGKSLSISSKVRVQLAVNMLRTEERLQRSLARQELLAQEMSHRVKNLFMLVNGMIHVSARSASSPEDMAQALTGRVKALAAAHALVHREVSDAESAPPVSDLAQLLNKILDPHEIADALGPTRFRLVGLLVSLGERATNGFALVCHELATNAAKYGALTSESGSVHIAWQLTDEGLLALAWQERGGPVIAAPPVSSGFGTKLAQETIVSELGGTIAYDWKAEGLAIHIAVPAARLAGGRRDQRAVAEP
jgi:two-component sensor histidine kinase